MLNKFHPGQRWVSESEPELGLGSVLRVTDRTVSVVFGASSEKREYALDNAPLRRVRFHKGDAIKNRADKSLVVEETTERRGLIYYRAEGQELCETDLSDAISFNKPEERLLAGQVDSPQEFDLRFAALKQQHQRRKSKVRGFVGGRIDLIPHQLYISSEVSGRLVPRVLLADEVGLGKTIEACLILHRLILTGRAQRALILVPESLVHQWFVELLRRFNLWFHIFDEERCASIEGANRETNPFLDDQFVLCSIGLFTGNDRRLQQALAAGWDILVVDEAHHLGWSPEAVSPEYAVVETLGRKIPGLLLLTATPEQLGMASHFARLRLLDPDRFFDLNEFVKEAEQYRDVARIADKLLNNQKLTPADIKILTHILADTKENVRSKLDKIAGGENSVREEMMRALLDQHGTGRVMFRNTRATITGFPKRIARLHALDAGGDAEVFDVLAEEFDADTNPKAVTTFQPKFTNDPRMHWLVDLLRTLDPEKVLLICRTQRKVEAIDTALRQLITIKMGVFHEGLPLVQRDRNAAWFAEENGARILICSEIGSEGRNFQFAHHLILFDLPLDPELLEQRIGRLDRIGQTSEIQVHLPFVIGSSQEVLVRWYHEGLNSFQKNLHGGRELLERFGRQVHDLAQDFHETEKTARAELDGLIAETCVARKELTVRLEQGRDRLLELNSFRSDIATRLVEDIGRQDGDQSLDQFMVSVFDHYSIHVEELGQRSFQLGSAGVFADSFPGLPAEGLTVTCARQRALSREDVQFLTWDHPLVTGALDMLLGSEKGNSSFAKWPDVKTPGLYLEAIYLLECIAPPHLHVDRFLPPTPLRVLVDHRGNDVGASIASEILTRHLKKGEAYTLLDRPELREDLFPSLVAKAQALASRQIAGLVTQARQEMARQLEQEIGRLKELQRVNRSVRSEEIELLIEQKSALDQHLTAARLRLDAIRLIQRGPV
ncbi:MAG: SNF2-related protein [Verrucomicrobiales bacterium]|nr:SNF2-related protein [Verrucomicrobiales bacterium]